MKFAGKRKKSTGDRRRKTAGEKRNTENLFVISSGNISVMQHGTKVIAPTPLALHEIQRHLHSLQIICNPMQPLSSSKNGSRSGWIVSTWWTFQAYLSTSSTYSSTCISRQRCGSMELDVSPDTTCYVVDILTKLQAHLKTTTNDPL